MRIIIDIPKEFEEDFKQDKFKDVLNRLSADAHLMAGNYEQETATMLIKAFDESIPMDRIVEQLEEARNNHRKASVVYEDINAIYELIGIEQTFNRTIEIVKAGGKYE